MGNENMVHSHNELFLSHKIMIFCHYFGNMVGTARQYVIEEKANIHTTKYHNLNYI